MSRRGTAFLAPQNTGINWTKWSCILGIPITACAIITIFLFIKQNAIASSSAKEEHKNVVQVVIRDTSPEKWFDAVWDNKIKRTITIKNISQDSTPLFSDSGQWTGTDTFSFLEVSCKKENKLEKLGELRPFSHAIQPGKETTFEIHEDITYCDPEGEIIIQVECQESELRNCYEDQIPYRLKYKKEDASSLQVIGVDATYGNNPNYSHQDDIELSAFRSDIIAELGTKETSRVYKTIPAKPFPVYHKKDKNVSWEGIVLLYNPDKHSEQSYMTEKMKFMLQKRYPYAPIIVKPYTEENFNFYTQAFEDLDCFPKDGKNECPGGQFDFPSLKSGLPGDENKYTAKVYHQNPNLDFMFMLPYNNQK